jgi:hypothetical protein
MDISGNLAKFLLLGENIQNDQVYYDVLENRTLLLQIKYR